MSLFNWKMLISKQLILICLLWTGAKACRRNETETKDGLTTPESSRQERAASDCIDIGDIPKNCNGTLEFKPSIGRFEIYWYFRVPNKHRPTFINFGSFFQGLRSYLRQLHYYLWVYGYSFSHFFPLVYAYLGGYAYQKL